jgi:hypothetical protein
MENIDEELQHELKMHRIRRMKNPTILMNTEDFEAFRKQVEAEINNFKVASPPTYNGIPVISTNNIERGNTVIYDDAWGNSRETMTPERYFRKWSENCRIHENYKPIHDHADTLEFAKDYHNQKLINNSRKK